MIYHYLLEKFNIIMYADDTTLYGNMEHFPADSIEPEINNNLEYLNRWFKLNKLSLNVAKTRSMIFRKRKKSLQCISKSTIFLY